MKFTYLSVLAFVTSALSQTMMHPNGDNGVCLDVKDGRFVDGNPLQVWPCNGTPSQQWIVNLGSPSTIRLGNTGFCLATVPNPANGTPIQIQTCNNNPQQQWVFTATTSGGIAKLANTNICLDLDSGNHIPGTVVQAWQCLDRDTNQVWTN